METLSSFQLVLIDPHTYFTLIAIVLWALNRRYNLAHYLLEGLRFYEPNSEKEISSSMPTLLQLANKERKPLSLLPVYIGETFPMMFNSFRTFDSFNFFVTVCALLIVYPSFHWLYSWVINSLFHVPHTPSTASLATTTEELLSIPSPESRVYVINVILLACFLVIVATLLVEPPTMDQSAATSATDARLLLGRWLPVFASVFTCFCLLFSPSVPCFDFVFTTKDFRSLFSQLFPPFPSTYTSHINSFFSSIGSEDFFYLSWTSLYTAFAALFVSCVVPAAYYHGVLLYFILDVLPKDASFPGMYELPYRSPHSSVTLATPSRPSNLVLGRPLLSYLLTLSTPLIPLFFIVPFFSNADTLYVSPQSIFFGNGFGVYRLGLIVSGSAAFLFSIRHLLQLHLLRLYPSIPFHRPTPSNAYNTNHAHILSLIAHDPIRGDSTDSILYTALRVVLPSDMPSTSFNNKTLAYSNDGTPVVPVTWVTAFRTLTLALLDTLPHTLIRFLSLPALSFALCLLTTLNHPSYFQQSSLQRGSLLNVSQSSMYSVGGLRAALPVFLSSGTIYTPSVILFLLLQFTWFLCLCIGYISCRWQIYSATHNRTVFRMLLSGFVDSFPARGAGDRILLETNGVEPAISVGEVYGLNEHAWDRDTRDDGGHIEPPPIMKGSSNPRCKIDALPTKYTSATTHRVHVSSSTTVASSIPGLTLPFSSPSSVQGAQVITSNAPKLTIQQLKELRKHVVK